MAPKHMQSSWRLSAYAAEVGLAYTVTDVPQSSYLHDDFNQK